MEPRTPALHSKLLNHCATEASNMKSDKSDCQDALAHLLLHYSHWLKADFLECRARKLYTPARIYKCKLGKGEGKFPIARPTGRVDFLGVRNFLFFVRKMQEITSVSHILQKRRKNRKERSFERFKTSIECDQMFTLVSSK